MALYNRALALAAYKRCDLKKAVEKQQRECEIFKSGENKKILEYYQKLLKKEK
jgi:hypothetical protein